MDINSIYLLLKTSSVSYGKMVGEISIQIVWEKEYFG